ncbi:alpha/beta fold hydrolase [Priestia megaterium]|uniref:alpha/beta fold hydrolase n=1 Tax=Priestia megaterium TaxID=1404 RepID=UPI001A952C5D|nr:alpha/beta fold hydrolase [Priestia megaterium]QSX24158.1 alpha/beta fold hydrolase [Priestia megaterium]
MALNLFLHRKNEKTSDNLIVLVHGLGASDNTWVHDESSWIDLFLTDDTFKNLDVAEIIYDTSHLANGVLALMGIKKIKLGLFRSFTVGKGPFTNIEILARELKREIDSKRIKQYKNVILLGHSMGGLVAIRYILEEFENNQPHNVKGMISLATPYNGSSHALYSQLIKSINKHAQIPSLEPNSNFLDGTIRLWQKHLDKMNLDFKFFFGTEDTIVPENSAIPHIVSSKWTGGVPLPGDHSGILKVEDHSSTSYMHVSETVKEIFEKDTLVKKKIIDERRKLTIAKSITRLKANGLDREQAIYLLENKQYSFEYLKPTVEKRLVVIVGEFGLGKSFAIDKIYLDLLLKADNESDFPIPISINAAQLDTNIQSYLENLLVDNSSEYWIIIDGMDEVSVSIASNILENMRIATERWNNLRIILTSRPLSIFKEITERINMKGLSEEEALDLVNFINNQRNHYHFHNFPKEIRLVIQRPLFAILLGLYLSKKNNLIPTTSGELLSYLIENALEKVEINESHTEQLLINLAMISTCQGNIPVKKSKIGDIVEIRNLLNSGIIIEENGYISFVLPILNQWFAAKALAENVIDINHIMDKNNLDYWKYPLIILITIFKENKIDNILSEIVEKEPGFASILIEESIKKWGIHTDITSLSAQECGEKIRMTMVTWVKSLGILADFIAPVDMHRNVLPIGVEKTNEWLSTSWYRGGDNLSEINILDQTINWFDWPTSRRARPGDGSSWYWRWALEEIRDNLTNIFKKRELPICTEIIYKELMWSTTLKIAKKGPFYTKAIYLNEVKFNLERNYQNISKIKVSKNYVPMEMYINYITDLESKNISVIECPLPGKDIDHPIDPYIWSAYSDEQLHLRTLKIYHEVIVGYKEIVETFFPILKHRLRKYVLYPYILKGDLILSENFDMHSVGPRLRWHLEPLPFNHTESIIDIKISKREQVEFNDENYYEIGKKIKEYRAQDCTWLSTIREGQSLDIFEDTPITDTIYKWLEKDLKSINMIK